MMYLYTIWMFISAFSEPIGSK